MLRFYKDLPFLRNEEGCETEPSSEKEIQRKVTVSKRSKEESTSACPSLPNMIVDSPPLSPSSSSDDNPYVTLYSSHEDLADVYPEGPTDAIGTDCGGPTDVGVKYNHNDRRSPLFVQEFILEMSRLSQPRRSYSMKMDFLDEMEEYSSEKPGESGVTSSEVSVSEDGGVPNRLRGIARLDANTRKLLQKELFQSLRMSEWQQLKNYKAM